jgi:hypothetical protein
VDNGEEFGGKSWMKIKELRKLISGFGCRSEADLLNEAMGYIYHYNNVREHSSLNYQPSMIK